MIDRSLIGGGVAVPPEHSPQDTDERTETVRGGIDPDGRGSWGSSGKMRSRYPLRGTDMSQLIIDGCIDGWWLRWRRALLRSKACCRRHLVEVCSSTAIF